MEHELRRWTLLFLVQKMRLWLNVKRCNTQLEKLHHRTWSEIKTQVFTLSHVLHCFSIHCAELKQHWNPDFLTKSVNITLQKRVDIANEYLQAYNLGAGVENHLSVICINVNVQYIQCFHLHLFSLTNLSENRINLST